MRAILILTLLGLTACGKGFESNKFATATEASVAPVILDNGIEHAFNSAQMQSIGSSANSMILDSALSLQGLNGINFNFGSNPSASVTDACPQGGTFSLVAQGTLAANISTTSIQSSLSAGSGTLILTNCVISSPVGPAVTLNGTVALTGIAGNLNVTLDLATSMHTFSAQSATHGAGTVQVQSGVLNQSCALVLSQSSSATGMVNSSTFAASGNVSANVHLELCGQSADHVFQTTF
jgi:hypothetical protein